jgi:23S rRNA pseudouridine2605 synthase
MLTRLQKILATAGIASRRKSEELILSGRVRINGKVIRELGTKADAERDSIEVDGRLLVAERPTTILLNKPRGVVCTAHDPEGRETVVDLVPKIRERLYPVGRLDFATSGALLLTNDGELSYRLTHPKYGVEKTYLVKIRGKVSDSIIDKWRKGVDIGDAVTKPAEVFRVEEEPNYTWLSVTIREGRNRQIRRMGEATGLDISKLKRVSFAGLTVENIPVGKYRELTSRELAKLKKGKVAPSIEAKKKTHKKKPVKKRK